jgi:glycosyltransferase involved in cell wall biosynthesis
MIFFSILLGLLTFIYCSAILWSIIGFLKIRKVGSIPQEEVDELKISIIIPVRNEAQHLLQCLLSIEEQRFNKINFVVLIVNDHSTDNSVEIINAFIDTTHIDLQFFSLAEKFSKKEALKLGIHKAKYPIIATTDGDCVLPKNWLTLISTQMQHDTDMLLGPILFKEFNGFLGGFQTLDMFALQGVEFGALGFKKPILNNAANLSYSLAAFTTVNGFDNFETPSGDDVFLLEKFEAANKNIIGLLNKDFIVVTEPEKKIKDFFNQRLRWSSKSKFYSNNYLLFFSALILLENLSLFFVYFALLLVENYCFFLAILLFSKWFIDFILLYLVADFFDKKRVLLYFIPVQIIYPIYILTIWIASLMMPFEWKERKFNE